MRQQRYIEKTDKNTLHTRSDTRDFLNTTEAEIEHELDLLLGYANDSRVQMRAATATGFDPHAQAQQPFPSWLSEFTQMTAWPGLDPPYILLDFINLAEVPNIPPYQQGICPGTADSCSFDCFKCVEPDDCYTCPKLSQTFDDGPSPATSKLLAHLNHKATFFTLGVNAVRYPETYKELQSKGHLIGSHTWSHKFLPSLSNEEIIAQIEWSIWAMNATGHHLPKWFRPPYGGYDNRVRHILRKFGMQAALWDYDTFDWQILNNLKTEDLVLADVTKWKNASHNPSGLILEHDGALPTVNAAIKANEIIGEDQLTVAQCMGGIDYIRVFDQ